jgi:hypothetical protein
MAYTNAAAAIVLVPAILVVTPRYGAAGAACVWLVLNASYLVTNVPLMHTRLLRGELRRWYVRDLGMPIAAAVVVALAGRLLAPAVESRALAAAWVGTVWLAALIACALSSSEVRPLLTQGRFRQPLIFRA